MKNAKLLLLLPHSIHFRRLSPFLSLEVEKLPPRHSFLHSSAEWKKVRNEKRIKKLREREEEEEEEEEKKSSLKRKRTE